MALCACGVLFILLLFMDLRMAIFCFIMVAMIDVWIIGWMWMLNISLDPVTYACLVMAVGLTVDYIIHITFAIIGVESKHIQNNNYRQRISIAMDEMGGSVLKGAITTGLGGLPLLLSTSKGFQYFYYMVSGILISAVLHGLVLVPALLGELPWIYKHDTKEMEKNDKKDKEIQMMEDVDINEDYGSFTN